MTRGFTQICLFVLGAPLIAISLRYLSTSFDPIALMFGRLSIGATLFLILAFRKWGRQYFSHFNVRSFAGILLAAVLNTVAAITWVKAVSAGPASVFQTIGVLGIPLTIFLGALFFPEERQVLSRKSFQMGAAIALLGTLLNVVCAGSVSFDSNTAILYSFVTICCYAVIGLILKACVASIPTLVITSSILSLSAGCLFVTSFITESSFNYFSNTPGVLLLLVLSGLMGTSVFTFLEMPILKERGLAVVKVLTLLFPVSTILLEFLLLGELASFTQVSCGAVILLGSLLALIGVYELPVRDYLIALPVRIRAKSVQLATTVSVFVSR